jgi:hypothetical protein
MPMKTARPITKGTMSEEVLCSLAQASAQILPGYRHEVICGSIWRVEGTKNVFRWRILFSFVRRCSSV